MSLQFNPDDPTLAQAMAALETAEKGFTPQPDLPELPTEDSAQDPQNIAPAEPEDDKGTPPEPKPGETPGAPATTDKKPLEKPAANKPEEGKSQFAKNEERKARTWKEINSEKEATRAEAAKIKAEREAFERERLAFEKKQAESTKTNQKPPEWYEQGAAELERNAALAEEKGDFKLADKLRLRADDAREFAKQLRANPPKPDQTAEQVKQAFDTEQKKWISKAGIDYPDLTKKVKDDKGNEVDSPSMAKLKAMLTPNSEGYDPVVHEAVRTSPAGWYYAARLAHSETVAARVPTLEKELADSRAEVKKLNGKLSVNGGGLPNNRPGPRDFTKLSREEQEEQLRAEAATRKNW